MSKDNLILKRFGQRVRQLRLQKGFSSQIDFANKSKLDRTYIGGIERGERNVALKNLEKIALYAARSISSAEDGITFVDQNTFSSKIESRKRLSPLALAREAKVLAVYDLTFMTEPYSGTLDNNQLIANIADWLASPSEEEAEEQALPNKNG